MKNITSTHSCKPVKLQVAMCGSARSLARTSQQSELVVSLYVCYFLSGSHASPGRNEANLSYEATGRGYSRIQSDVSAPEISLVSEGGLLMLLFSDTFHPLRVSVSSLNALWLRTPVATHTHTLTHTHAHTVSVVHAAFQMHSSGQNWPKECNI